jgi:hypothetical protein
MVDDATIAKMMKFLDSQPPAMWAYAARGLKDHGYYGPTGLPRARDFWVTPRTRKSIILRVRKHGVFPEGYSVSARSAKEPDSPDHFWFLLVERLISERKAVAEIIAANWP